MRRCEICGSRMEKGGFVVVVSELINGFGIAVMHANGLGSESAGGGACGKSCAIEKFNREMDRLMGIEAMFTSPLMGRRVDKEEAA